MEKGTEFRGAMGFDQYGAAWKTIEKVSRRGRRELPIPGVIKGYTWFFGESVAAKGGLARLARAGNGDTVGFAGHFKQSGNGSAGYHEGMIARHYILSN
jgi:hypothetical protein